jgi:hypothetical protein
MVFWVIKTYIKEAIKLKNDYPESFDIWDSIKLFPTWRMSLNKKSNPLQDERPWITFRAIDFLEKTLTKDMRVYEYGMGGSTLFLAKRVKEIISIEHDPTWFNRVKEIIKEKGYNNWKGYLIEPEIIIDPINNTDPSDPESYISEDKGFNGQFFRNYAMSIDQYSDQYFDLIVIDGRARPSCFKHSLAKIKKGGFIVLDNSERDYYYVIHEALASKNWQKYNFYGPGPYGLTFWQTSFWKKIN